VSQFDETLRETLARNEEVDRRRAAGEAELERREAERAERDQRRERDEREARAARHAELVEHFQQLARQVEAASPERFLVRTGWTESGEEFLAKLSTVQLRPKRSLLVEFDRDDDEVLVRWSSDLGESLELYRLLEFSVEMLRQLVVQVVDQELWSGRDRPPPFPGNPD
jgi:hypothetical protein